MSGSAILGLLGIIFGALYITIAAFSKLEQSRHNLALYVSGGIAMGGGIVLVLFT